MNGYAANSTMPLPPIPVWGELSENSHLGFETKYPAWHPGSNTVNSTTTIGFRANLFLNVIRQIHSARYYNTMTGRFVSMDPENGIVTDPKTLHKFIYAAGDPVNLADPTGRAPAAVATSGGGDLAEYGILVLKIAVGTMAAVDAYACAVKIQYAMDALAVQGYTSIVPAGLCSAKGKQRWTCLASGHYVQIGTGNTTRSPDFAGYGNSQTQACQAAISAFQASAPRGFYTRHPQCHTCWKN